MFGYALFNLRYALVQRMLILGSIYGILVFHDVPFVFNDTKSVVFSFFTYMLQFSWWCLLTALLTALFIVRATLVSLLFSLVYAHVSCCVKVGLSMLCWLQGMPMFHDTPLVVHETHATLFTCYFHSILH
jgi:hypothetical protein